jgi:hypothetical protein
VRRLGGRRLFSDHGWNPTVPGVVPRNIWIYWGQGLDNAPEMVSHCVARWRALHPGWQVTVLDRTTAVGLVAMPELPDSILPAHYADVLRTRLLAEHGGVWVDATTWPARPLDDWLPPAAQAGFFIHTWIDGDREFYGRSHPRLIGNWFIAASPGNPMIAGWDKLTCTYWKGRQRTSNYFWHNDGLEFLVRTDRECRKVWNRMPKYGAMAPHLVQRHFLGASDNPVALRKAIQAGVIPVHKLNWRLEAPIAEIETFLLSAMGPDEGPGPDQQPVDIA